MVCNRMQEAYLNMDTGSQQPPPTSIPRLRQVHIITDRFSMANTYLINEERMIVVDPGSILNAQLLLSYLARFLHRQPEEIDLIVLTHMHPDHTAGADALRKKTGAPIAASNAAQHIARELAAGGVTGVSQFAGQMFSQARLPGVLHLPGDFWIAQYGEHSPGYYRLLERYRQTGNTV